MLFSIGSCITLVPSSWKQGTIVSEFLCNHTENSMQFVESDGWKRQLVMLQTFPCFFKNIGQLLKCEASDFLVSGQVNMKTILKKVSTII